VLKKIYEAWSLNGSVFCLNPLL